MDCGPLPTPALAYAAMSRGLASVMVTGSHIPAERNGLKFYLASGEITKSDEDAISRHAMSLSGAGSVQAPPQAMANDKSGRSFLSRIIGCLPARPLSGLSVGVYEHSTVARDLLVLMLEELGAKVIRLGRSGTFIALDTEAIEDNVSEALRRWASEHHLDAIVSADGDGDRPLIADEQGNVLRGDVIGMLTAQYVGAGAIVTPVTSNSGIEQAIGKPVIRTRVGSPYVIAGMEETQHKGYSGVIGFEANGGVLVGDDMPLGAAILTALPTRDAFLPVASVLCHAAQAKHSLAQIVKDLALPMTAATKIEDLPEAALQDLISALKRDNRNITLLLQPLGEVANVDKTDGIRARLTNGRIVFFRPSGNEPALRCYVEAESDAEARKLLSGAVSIIEGRLG